MLNFSIAISLVAVFICTFGCSTKRKKKVSSPKISNAAALTKLTALKQFNLLANGDASTAFCLMEKNDKAYFINSRKFNKPQLFISEALKSFRGLTPEDINHLRSHPQLKEFYCGRLTRAKSAKKNTFLFTLQNEDLLSGERVALVFKNLKSRIKVPSAKLKYQTFNEKFYTNHQRYLKAQGIHVLLSRLDTADKLRSEGSEEYGESFEAEEFQFTDFNSIDPSDEKNYGHLFSNSRQYAHFISSNIHHFLMQKEVTMDSCNSALVKCKETMANKCQIAHGKCLTALIGQKKVSLEKILDAFSKDGNQRNTALLLFYFQNLMIQESLDQRLISDNLEQIRIKAKGAESIELKTSLNLTGNIDEFFNPNQSAHKVSFANLTPESLATQLLNQYASFYTKDNFTRFKTKNLDFSQARIAVSIEKVFSKENVRGFVYIFPELKSRQFEVKIVPNTNSEQHVHTPVYLNISPSNKITTQSKQKYGRIERQWLKNDKNSLNQSTLINDLAVLVKKRYLNDLNESRDNKRLKSYEFEIQSDGKIVISD